MKEGLDRSFAYLVGAGPGDVGLLTLRGKEVLSQADVIIYDSLVNEQIIDFAPEQAERIHVGKRAGQHSYTQEEINHLLIEKLSENKRVVRLKGGDPFTFARGGEEIEVIDEAGFFYEVVPGVTSGIAVPAYAGVPLTHRECSSNVTFVTGHSQGDDWSRVNWKALAEAGGTLVIFMGVRKLDTIVNELVSAGVARDEPAILIQWGTTNEQRSVHGALAQLPDLVEKQGLGAPAIVVIGPTVNLREKLHWFEQRPLFGKRIALTRTRNQSRELRALFRSQGATVLEIPSIQIENIKVEEWELPDLKDIDWLVYTSSNGVSAFFEAFLSRHDLRDLKGIQIACVGPSTLAALEKYHLPCDFMPTSYRAKSLAEQWPHSQQKQKVLFVCGNHASRSVEEGLSQQGISVQRLEVYRTIEEIDFNDKDCQRLTEEGADWVVFCSPSAVRSFMEHRDQWPWTGMRVASIGPATSESLAAAGVKVDAEPQQSRLTDLVQEVVHQTKNKRRE